MPAKEKTKTKPAIKKKLKSKGNPLPVARKPKAKEPKLFAAAILDSL